MRDERKNESYWGVGGAAGVRNSVNQATQAAKVKAANTAAQQQRTHQLVTGQITPQQFGQQHTTLSAFGKRHGLDLQAGMQRAAAPREKPPAYQLPSEVARSFNAAPRRDAAASVVPGSLASAIDARGNKHYDNDSIRRMLARNGDTDWQNYGRGSQPQAAAAQGGIARRAAPGAAQMGGGAASALISSKTAEKERQARISELESAMFKLGSLDSRGKRDLWKSLQAEKGALVSQRYDADTKRDLQRADHQHNADSTNANLRDRAADRQNRQDQFDASMAWDRERHGDNMALGLYDRMLQQQEVAGRNAAAALKAQSDARIDSAKELREQQKHDREMDAYFNKQAEDRISQLMESGLSREQATQAMTQEWLNTHKDPTLADAGARGIYNADAAVRRLFDTESNLIQRGVAGDGWEPFTSQNLPEGVTPRLTEYNIERGNGWLARGAGWLNDTFGTNVNKPSTITYTDANGGIARRYVDDETAKRLRIAQMSQREADRRRNAEGIQRRGN